MIGWAIEALIASALLMAVVLVIRAPVRRHFGPGIAYALWALPAIRLLLPPLPQLHSATPQLLTRASETVTIYVIEPLGGSAAAPASLYSSLGPALAVLWGVGAAAFLVWHAFGHWRFCRRMIAASTYSEQAVDIEVIETAAASGPLAFGIFRRYVAFPRDFAERYDADERELALLHELGHHQRGDLIANWIALAVLALHWFNPLAWRAFRAFRADQEMANDALVLAGRSAIDRHTYACAIVKAAHGGAVSAACHLHTIQDLKGRLRMLTTGRRSRLRLTLGGTAVAALMIAGLAATASGTPAAATVRAGVEKATGIDIAAIDAKVAAKLQSAPAAMPEPALASAAMPEGADLPPPPPPPARAVPPAPATNVMVSMSDDGGRKVSKRYKIVRVDKDGKTMTEDWVGPMNVPDVRSSNCGTGGSDDKNMVVNKMNGEKRIIIICNDRIERVVSLNKANIEKSKDIERQAYAHALEGLRKARARVANDERMSAEEKRDALDSIDDSIKDMESDLANPD
ncbi:MAG: M56 family metallopeptidase [Sphingomonas sp.]|uniref:M56 family metallopeptidase n=1 Tax=Sphingomonas sp. TaxID=28214 RepID=UPI003F8146F4